MSDPGRTLPTSLRALQIAAIIVVLAVAMGGVVAATTCLADYPTHHYSIAAGLIACAVAGLIWLLPARWGAPRRWIAGLSIFVAITLAVPLSALWPGGITASRFGFTVVGACPIPAFDFTISAGGVVVPRNKSHRIAKEEVAALSKGADEVIIAIGWNGVADPDPEVLRMPGVHVLKTREAFETYNRLRREGKRVALLAHTTC